MIHTSQAYLQMQSWSRLQGTFRHTFQTADKPPEEILKPVLSHFKMLFANISPLELFWLSVSPK